MGGEETDAECSEVRAAAAAAAGVGAIVVGGAATTSALVEKAKGQAKGAMGAHEEDGVAGDEFFRISMLLTQSLLSNYLAPP